MQDKKHIVVIGNGMVGFRFCEKLLEYDAKHQYRLTVLGDELAPAYDRVALSTLFSGESGKELIFSEKRWYDHYKIDLRLGTRVERIDRAEKTVETAKGETIAYDHLVLATGSRPHVPAIPGASLSGAHVYRTMDDVFAIRAAGRYASNAVIIGGGLLGLEAAEACREMGLNTTVLERESFLLARQLDQTAGGLLDQKIENLGIDMRLDAHVEAIEGEKTACGVRLARGETLPAELVIFATGIIPNDELARDAGLEIGARGGIAIAETTRTSDPDIFAIGECAALNDELFGLVAPGYAMAEAAAASLGQINRVFEPGPQAAKLKLLDLKVASIGASHLEEPESRHVIDQDLEKGVYKKLICSPDGTRLLGAILIGESSEFEKLRKHIEQETTLPDDPGELLAPIGDPISAEIEMEDEEVVCFCNYITKGDLRKAIAECGLKTTSAVMDETHAATLCGGCYETLDAVTRQLVNGDA